jgi:hypothetical protein
MAAARKKAGELNSPASNFPAVPLCPENSVPRDFHRLECGAMKLPAVARRRRRTFQMRTSGDRRCDK